MTNNPSANNRPDGKQRDRCATLSPDASKPAWKSPAAIVLFVVVTVGGLAADLISKQCVFDSMLSDPEMIAVAEELRDSTLPADHKKWEGPLKKTRYVLNRAFRTESFLGTKFTLSLNDGVVFGLPVPRWAVAIASIFIIILVCVFFATLPAKIWSLHVALGCVLAGALGNFYDRLFSSVSLIGLPPIERNVRDFIDCSDLYWRWIFNIADVLLVVGVALIALHWLRQGKCAKANTPSA